MEEKEIQKLLEGVAEKNKAAIKTEIENAVNAAGLITTAQLAAKFEAMGLKDGAVKEITDALEKQGEQMRKYFEKGTGEAKSIDQIIDEKSAEIKKLYAGEIPSGRIKIEVPKVQKAPVLTTSVSGNTAGQRIAEIGQIAYAGMVMAPLFRPGNIGAGMNGTIRYYDQNAVTRNAAGRAENTAYAESAIDWIERTSSAVKITDSIPVSKESLNDVEFIKSELDRLLNINMALKEDQQLYAGTGVAPELKGINVYAGSVQATLEAAPYVDQFTQVSIYDLIAVLRVVIATSKQSKYMPNVVLMNPVDILKFKLKKASDGHYVLPPFIAANGMLIDGVTVVETNQVATDTLTIGDFRYGTLYVAQGLEIEIGLVNDQFVKDAATIKASKRELLLVRNVDADAFGKLTSITRAIAYLDSGVANPV
jgi:hypothetical protein